MVIVIGLLSLALVLMLINTYLLNQRILDLKQELWDSYDWIDPVSCVVDDLEVPELDEGTVLRCVEDIKEGNRAAYRRGT